MCHGGHVSEVVARNPPPAKWPSSEGFISIAASPQCLPCRLCESVTRTLEGQRLGSFTRVSSAVRTAVEEAITRILTPKRSIDVLREAQQAKAR